MAHPLGCHRVSQGLPARGHRMSPLAPAIPCGCCGCCPGHISDLSPCPPWGRPQSRLLQWSSLRGAAGLWVTGAAIALQAVLPGRVFGSGEALCGHLRPPTLLPRHRAAPPSPPDRAPVHPRLPTHTPGEAGSGGRRAGRCCQLGGSRGPPCSVKAPQGTRFSSVAPRVLVGLGSHQATC